MAISRAQMLKELLPGLNALFGLEYEKYEDEHTMIYDSESSDRSFEEEVKLSGFGAAPVKAEGSAISYDSAQESFTARYNHETVAMGFSITEEAMEDNLYDSLSARYTKALARGMAYTKQVKSAFPLNNGFSNAFQSGDGVNLFTAAGDGVAGGNGHPLVNGGTNSNRPVTAADLNEISLEDAVINIAAYTDERGLLIAARPRRLIVPPALMFVATRLLETEGRVGTADNDINAMKSMGMLPEGAAVNHFFTDADAYFVKTDCPNGFKVFNRTPLTTGTEGDFDTGNLRFKARERYAFGVSDWRCVFGTPGA